MCPRTRELCRWPAHTPLRELLAGRHVDEFPTLLVYSGANTGNASVSGGNGTSGSGGFTGKVFGGDVLAARGFRFVDAAAPIANDTPAIDDAPGH